MGRVAITSPSASPVLVFIPKHALTQYALSASNKNCENLVASPKHMGSKPVAKGSKLPVCPALFAENKRLAVCNA